MVILFMEMILFGSLHTIVGVLQSSSIEDAKELLRGMYSKDVKISGIDVYEIQFGSEASVLTLSDSCQDW